MKKTTPKKLDLSVVTVRKLEQGLSNDQLQNVVGGQVSTGVHTSSRSAEGVC